MGQILNYETGKANIGRLVKVFGRHRHGTPGKLVEALPRCAVVQIANHPHKTEHPWEDIRDWTSHNAGPLNEPAPPTPKAQPTPKPTPASPPTQAAAPEPASPFAVYADLSAKLEAAVANVAAAEEMVDQALEHLQQARKDHAGAVEELKALRTQAAKALAAIDQHLVGTTAAQTN